VGEALRSVAIWNEAGQALVERVVRMSVFDIDEEGGFVPVPCYSALVIKAEHLGGAECMGVTKAPIVALEER